jgi:glycosyltransferase involved in cell wall biosynthesis
MSRTWMPTPARVVDDAGLPPAPPLPRVKVLHVITRLDAGAGGNTLVSAVGMDRGRYEVWIAGAAGGPLWKDAHRQGIRTVEMTSLRREVAPVDDLKALVALVRLIRRERFGIVHLHSAKAGVLGRLAAALCRVPVVVYTLHGRDPWWPAPDGRVNDLGDTMSGGLRSFLFLERALRPLTDRFVAVSPTVARDAVLARVATPGRIDIAASAVDIDGIAVHARAGAAAALGVPDGAPLIGSVGRLDAQKAPLDFVHMAAEVHRRHPEARFVMIGEGELARAAAGLAQMLDVPVIFAGQRSDVADLVAAFDVFVISSLYEGVGRALTEALASGRPVVATAVDGVVDVVVPGATGLLAAPRDPSGLAERVCWMLEHPVEAARMGAQARTSVCELFSPARLCSTLDEIYSAALGLVPLAGPGPVAAAIPTSRRVRGSVADVLS